MRLTIILALAAIALAAPLPAQEPQISVTEKVEVAVRTVTAVITDSAGRPLETPPSVDEIEVLEDGVRCEVIGIEPVRERSVPRTSESPASPVASSPEHALPVRKPRRQALYLDAALLRVPSVREVTKTFAAHVDAVLSLGPLEIVVADPGVTTFLPPTRDPAAVRAALEKLGRKLPGRDRIATLRRDAVQADSTARRTAALPGRIMAIQSTGFAMTPSAIAAREEAFLIKGGLLRLSRWATSSPRVDERILYLASDGFDVDLGPYRLGTAEASIRSEIVPGILQKVRDTERALLAGGWTTVPVAVNAVSNTFMESAEMASGRTSMDPNSSVNPFTLADHGLDTLRSFADATGGELLVAAAQLEREVSRLGSGWLVTFRMTRPPDGQLHDLVIRSSVPGMRVRATHAIPAGTTTSTSVSRVLDALEGSAAAGPLPVALAFSNAARGKKGKRAADMHVTVSLAGLAPLLARLGPGHVRVSVAVEVPGSPPFVLHDEKTLPLELPRSWVYDAPIVWPKGARRIAVVAEELATGAAGSAVAELSAVR